MVSRSKIAPEMTSADLTDLLIFIELIRVDVWLDGGWGVDALLGVQTRAHKDVDLILRVENVPKFQQELEKKGFSFKEGCFPHSFVLTNGQGLEIDIHAVSTDQDGNGRYQMQNGEYWIYPAEGFNGKGTINGKAIRCLSPEAQVLCHAYGYTPVEKDFKDMEHLQRRFGVKLPPHLRSNLSHTPQF